MIAVEEMTGEAITIMIIDDDDADGLHVYVVDTAWMVN